MTFEKKYTVKEKRSCFVSAKKKKRREKLFVCVCTIDKSDWLNTFVFIINS